VFLCDDRGHGAPAGGLGAVMSVSRRRCVEGLGGLLGACAIPLPAAQAADGATAPSSTRIILLGTKGGPTLGTVRNNAATVILINGVPYLVDCGHGVTRQLMAAGIGLGRLRYVFITHHHSDHTLEYGPLLYNAWVSPRPPRIDAYGPVGLKKMTEAFLAYQAFDIDTRVADEGMTHLRKLVSVHEFKAGGLVMQNADVRVTSVRVPHPPITQAYAYRFDAKDRSVVISGDTAYSPELARLAKDADVLVHEVMYLPGVDGIVARATNAPRLREHLLASHTTTEDVGRLAAEAGVKTLVLSHFVPGLDRSVTDAQWVEGVAKHFKGRIIVGQDLMEI
jgi:ribonuclease BN (tRNA processing enzyme)